MPVTHMHPVYHAWHCGATDGTMCTDDRSVTCPDCRARIDEPMRAAISKCGGWQWWQAGADKIKSGSSPRPVMLVNSAGMNLTR